MFNILSATKHEADAIPKEFKPILLLHETAMERNKRCLMAYHKFRTDKLKEVRLFCF